MSDTFKCPSCGATHRIVPVRADSGWGRAVRDGWQRLHSGDSTAPAQEKPNQPIPTAKIVTPTNVRGGFRGAGDDPVVQALVSAGAVGACVLIFGFSREWLLKDIAFTTTFTLVGTFAVAWFGLLRISQGLLTTIEETFDIDLNRNGHVGEPPKGMQITIEEQHKSGAWTGYFRSPIEEPILGQFARAVLAGRPTGERKWTGAGQPFSVNEYIEFRDELLQHGLVRWKNEQHHRQGFKLTARGRAVFKQLAAIPATTPPELQQ